MVGNLEKLTDEEVSEAEAIVEAAFEDLDAAFGETVLCPYFPDDGVFS